MYILAKSGFQVSLCGPRWGRVFRGHFRSNFRPNTCSSTADLAAAGSWMMFTFFRDRKFSSETHSSSSLEQDIHYLFRNNRLGEKIYLGCPLLLSNGSDKRSRHPQTVRLGYFYVKLTGTPPQQERGMNDPAVKSRIENERMDGSGVERG